MRSLLTFELCCVLAACSADGQSLRLNGSRVVFPDGNVVGAAFLNGQIFVQQAVLRADGPKINSTRRILAWSLKTNSILEERFLVDGQSPLVGNECGRVVPESAMGRIFVCANSKTLVSLSAETLNTVSEIHCTGKIFDFAVDDTARRVFVTCQSDSSDQYLIIFDLASGRQLDEVKISSGALAGAEIGIDPRTKRIAIAQSLYGRTGYTTNLYGCGYAQEVMCELVATTGQTAQIAILGQEVLLASGLIANDRHVCLTGVNLATKAVTHEYCSSRTGIHYGVGIVDQKYVVGYSGVEKWLAWKEITRNASSSVSVWKYEDGRVVAEAIQDGVPPSFPNGVRVASSRDTSRFLLFSQTSNVAYLYSVEEQPNN